MPFRVVLLLWIGWMGQPVVVAGSSEFATPAAPESPTTEETGGADLQAARVRLVEEIARHGRSRADAELMVSALTDDDVRVLNENPGMLEPAGNSTLIAWIIFLTLAIAGVTLIVAANTT